MQPLDRRRFLQVVGGGAAAGVLAACVGDVSDGTGGDDSDAAPGGPSADAGPGGLPADATGAPAVDAEVPCEQDFVVMYDTYAQALYMDGTYGPLTGTITVAMVLADQTITLDFWHGHGGQIHRFTLEHVHFEQLKAGQVVNLTTTTVDGHEHTLFIDPTDPEYRVPGAPATEVPVGECM